jgi:methylmalonyl-CoA mutase
MDSLMDAGLNGTDAAKQLAFQLACDADHLLNNVKLRALRQIWTHVAAAYGAEQATLNLVVETSQRMLSKREPWVNHLRNVNAATAAALGGAQTIIVHPHNRVDGHFIDDDISIAKRVARNTPIILSEESAMPFVADPMSGSYAVEQLTAELVDISWTAIQELESAGGLINALQTGDWQKGIAQAHAERVQRMHDNTDVRVGINQFNDAEVNAGTIDPNVQKPANIEAAVVIDRLTPVREAQAFGA